MHVDSAYSEALKLEALELYNLQLDDQNHCVLTKDKRLLSSYYPGMKYLNGKIVIWWLLLNHLR